MKNLWSLLCYLIGLFLIASSYLFILGCNNKKKNVEKSVTAQPSQAQNHIQPVYASLPPPASDEIKAAIDRVFDGAVMLDKSVSPAYVVGDFNGDGSEDLAVWVKPAPDRLGEINNELSNWILLDPHKTFVAAKKARGKVNLPMSHQVESVSAGESLLAVIHGYKQKGWRDPQARQSYLLHDVPGRSLSTAHIDRLPGTMHSAEAIFPEPEGFLYWAGGAYAWKQSREVRF